MARRTSFVLVAALGISIASSGVTPASSGDFVGYALANAFFDGDQQSLIARPLSASTTYRIEAFGRAKYMGEGGWPAINYSDAECSQRGLGNPPQTNAFNTLFGPTYAAEDPLDVYVNGAQVTWTPKAGTADPLAPGCSTTSEYFVNVTGVTNLTFRFWDFPGMYLDNGFAIELQILEA